MANGQQPLLTAPLSLIPHLGPWERLPLVGEVKTHALCANPEVVFQRSVAQALSALTSSSGSTSIVESHDVMEQITRILNSLRDEEVRTDEQLILALYNELRALARHKMSAESAGHTLQPTALVNEVWLRLVVPNRSQWQNRAHFFAAASEAMRRILVDHARRKQSSKRGGGAAHEELLENSIALSVPPEELLAVDEAVEELSIQDPQVAELVKLRYYVGMTMPEASAALGLAPRSAERLWTFGRAWLRNRIRQSLTFPHEPSSGLAETSTNSRL